MNPTYDPKELRGLVRPTRLKFDEIGFRTMQSRVPQFWPSRGWVAADRVLIANTGACPFEQGDGICIARDVGGAASGGQALAGGVLIVGWNLVDVLGDDTHLVCVSRAFVLGAVTLKDAAHVLLKVGADLSGANLRRADLSGANLRRADLRRANLYGANLRRANLRRANLYGVDLRRANLSGVDLRGADLYGANLYGANLSGVDLSGANLYGANLRRTDLSGANLRRTDLSGAIGLESA